MATYGSPEWAQEQYRSKPYYQQLQEQQAQQQSAYNQERYNSYAEQQYKDAMIKYHEEQKRQESLWYKLTQQSARDTAKEAGNAISSWYNQQDQQNNGNLVGRDATGMWSNFSGINRFTGLPWQNYGNLPVQAQYQFGLPTTPQDYYRSMDQFRNAQMPSIIEGMTTKKQPPTQEELNILREQRRGYQVGMPGIDAVVPPQVLGNNQQPSGDYSGYGGYGFPSYMFPSYSGGGGWKYTPSQSASKWYNTMVQWNIGNENS